MNKFQHDVNNVLTSVEAFFKLYEYIEDDLELKQALEEDDVYPHIIEMVLAKHYGRDHVELAENYVRMLDQ